MPRRTFMAEATYYSSEWRLPGLLTGVGATDEEAEIVADVLRQLE